MPAPAAGISFVVYLTMMRGLPAGCGTGLILRVQAAPPGTKKPARCRVLVASEKRAPSCELTFFNRSFWWCQALFDERGQKKWEGDLAWVGRQARHFIVNDVPAGESCFSFSVKYKGCFATVSDIGLFPRKLFPRKMKDVYSRKERPWMDSRKFGWNGTDGL